MSSVLRSFGRACSKHAPLLWMIGGIASMGTAVYIAVRRTPEALKLIDDAKDEKFEAQPEEVKKDMVKTGEEMTLTPIEYVKTCWKIYLPVAIYFAGGCVCFILSHKISSRRQAAMAAAYNLLQSSAKNYQEYVADKLGPKKEREIREEAMSKDVVFSNFDDSQIINTGHGNYLMYDYLSGRWFRSDLTYVEKVINRLNQRLMTEMWISGNDFYFEMGLPQIGYGKDLGWRLEDGFIDFDKKYCPGPKGNGDACCLLEPTLQHWPNYKFGDLSR